MEDTKNKLKVYRSHFQDEINSSYLYALISQLEKDNKLFSVYTSDVTS